jgi:cbb3-type cytochrome oxidase subunit 1
MGSTIGINTMILLASVFFVIREELPVEVHSGCSKQVTFGYWMANVSLAVFFVSMILAGLGKGFYGGGSFQEMMLSIWPFLLVFAVSGVTLMLGIWIVLFSAVRLINLRLSPASRGALAAEY